MIGHLLEVTMIGTTLSHYRIISELGRGGMGIVYLAEDTKLDRQVAIKVLPASALSSADDRARFYREAKAAAALNHPNIAQVYEIDEAVPSDAPHGTQPSPFIAMGYIDGETLDARIKKGPLKLKEAVRIATQIAGALGEAHDKGIVHRDVKASNVMLTSKGDAKVLDFGLALTAASTRLTRMGSTLGTVAYMSPEQARGEEVDRRTDLWALGVVLYEMVAGRNPFGGDYEQAVVYSILNAEPEPLTALRTGVPMELERIVNKLLRKPRVERYQSTSDLIVDLRALDLTGSGMSKSVVAVPPDSTGVPVGNRLEGRLSYVLAVLLLFLGVLIGWALFRSGAEPESARATKQFILRIEGLSTFQGFASTRDGSALIGFGRGESGTGTYRVDLRTGRHTLLGTDGGSFSRSVSYDDEWFSYLTRNGVSRVSTTGGAPVLMYESSGWIIGHTWLPDGSLVFAESDSLFESFSLLRLPRTGGDPVTIATSADSSGWGNPVSLHESTKLAARYGPRDDPWVSIVDLESGSVNRLTPGIPYLYTRSGHLLYFEPGQDGPERRFVARSLDVQAEQFVGPRAVIEQETTPSEVWLSDDGAYYSLTLVGTETAGAADLILYENGQSADIVSSGLQNPSAQPRLSPDGNRVMIRVDEGGGQVLVEYNLQTGVTRRFTIPADGDADNAAYSPNGTEIIFESDGKMYRRNVNRSGRLVELDTPAGIGSLDWSPSGQYVVFNGENANGYAELYLMDLEDDTVTRLDGGAGQHGWPRFSPGERFISYGTMNEQGRSIWVMSIEDGNRLLVSTKLQPGGDYYRHPMTAWTNDGKYLYYSTDDGVTRVPISLDPYFEITGPPENVLGPEVLQFDVSGDGSRIVGVAEAHSLDERSVVEIGVLTDFHAELDRIAPAVDR